MITGIPKEIKNNENRVAPIPAGAKELVERGRTVYVQHTAGINNGSADDAYVAAGARILPAIEDVYGTVEMIVKVKEPIAGKYPLVRKGQLVFTYFHFTSDEALTLAMVKSGSICLTYETVENPDHTLPLLTPMSKVTGCMSVRESARLLEKPQGGKGALLGNVPGVEPGKVLALGGGVIDHNTTLMTAGLDADVTTADISLPRLRYPSEAMPKNVKTLSSSTYTIEQELSITSLVTGTVLTSGAEASHLITRDMLKLLKPGNVSVDVTINQDGCFETSHPTTCASPVYEINDILHYCVANILGAVPQTSTLALTNAALPYVIKLASRGWEKACEGDPGLELGLNIVEREIVYPAVAYAFPSLKT